MKRVMDMPEGIKAAAVRFAKACERDGYGAELSMCQARGGQPRYVTLFEGELQHTWMFSRGLWFYLMGEEADDE